MRISNYDENSYNYADYWKDREYEDFSEKYYLKKAFKDLSGEWFIDIGGSFGRNLDLYANKYKQVIILDYSLQTLQKNREEIMKTHSNTTLIAANAYYLPFRDSVFDGALMVRVLHHLESPQQYFKELARVMHNSGTYIQEFANKVHIKARLKAFLKGNFRFFNEEPYEQPMQGNFEGGKSDVSVFLNFHPNHIKKLLKENGFTIKDKQAVSFLRIPLLKKILPLKLLEFKEIVLQSIFKISDLTPSIFFKSVISKPETRTSKYSIIEQTLVCPRCKGELEFLGETARCNHCNLEFTKKEGIWDFRID